jgi:hypothetical protein
MPSAKRLFKRTDITQQQFILNETKNVLVLPRCLYIFVISIRIDGIILRTSNSILNICKKLMKNIKEKRQNLRSPCFKQSNFFFHRNI